MRGGAIVNPAVRHQAGQRAIPPAAWRDRVVAWTFGAMGLLAAVCGVLLIATDGLGMSRSDLRDSPFGTFVVPGLILSIVVGGSQIAAAVAVLKRHGRAAHLALAAGLVMLGWIIVESVMIPSGRGLQVFILAYAIAETRLAWVGRRDEP
jgi:hypothetical protein